MSVHSSMVPHIIVPCGNRSPYHESFGTLISQRFPPHAALTAIWPLQAFFGIVFGIRTPRPFAVHLPQRSAHTRT